MEKNINLSRERLIQIGEELSRELELVPAIDVSLSDSELLIAISVAAKLLHPLDDIKRETIIDLANAGIEIPRDVLEKHNVVGRERAVDTDRLSASEESHYDLAVAVDKVKQDEEIAEELVKKGLLEKDEQGNIKPKYTSEEEVKCELEKELKSIQEANSTEKSSLESSTDTIPSETSKSKSSKSATKQSEKKVKKRAEYLTYLEELIQEGKYTRDEIISKVLAKYPDTKKATVSSVISDSKNFKYTRFKGRVIVEDKNKKLSFKELDS